MKYLELAKFLISKCLLTLEVPMTVILRGIAAIMWSKCWQKYLWYKDYIARCSKIGKKCNFKSTKTHFLQFQKRQKINFYTRKKFKIAKFAIFGLKKIGFLAVLNFVLVQIWFIAIFEIAKMCFCTFEIALLSNFRVLSTIIIINNYM